MPSNGTPMNDNTDNDGPSAGRDDDARHGGPRAAERRRYALRRFLRRRSLSIADLYRALGLSTGKAFYNFDNGRSDASSLPLIERILELYDDATFEELVGLPSRPRSKSPARRIPCPTHNVVVQMVLHAGERRRSVDLPYSEMSILPLPPMMQHPGRGAFGAVVGSHGAEQAYREGAILVCRDFKPGSLLPPPGTRVVVQHWQGKRVEAIVREVVLVDGEPWLISCSTSPERQRPLRPSALAERRNRLSENLPSDDTADILGVVMWSWMPEPGTRTS